MKVLIIYGIVTFSTFFLVPGCAEDSEAGRTMACADVCSTYNECIKEIDVISCTSECEDKADADSTYQQSASRCETCIDDKTCEEAKPCWESCPSMPPVAK